MPVRTVSFTVRAHVKVAAVVVTEVELDVDGGRVDLPLYENSTWARNVNNAREQACRNYIKIMLIPNHPKIYGVTDFT